MPIALIITEDYKTPIFNEYIGFFLKQVSELRKYFIVYITTFSVLQIELQKKPNVLSNSEIGFLWIRGHGTQKEIFLSDKQPVRSDNIHEIFDWLPKMLSEEAVIFLDSCSTGNLKGDFYNNVQFQFAKLTLNLPNVKIAAPTEDLHLCAFQKTTNNGYAFHMIESPYKLYNNITSIIGPLTKNIIKNILQESKELGSVTEHLKESLSLDKKQSGTADFYIPTFSDEVVSLMKYANFNLMATLCSLIMHNKTQETNAFIDFFNLDVEGIYLEKRDPLLIPLCVAINFQRINFVKFLLEKGADPFLEFDQDNGKKSTPLDYLREQIITYKKILDEKQNQPHQKLSLNQGELQLDRDDKESEIDACKRAIKILEQEILPLLDPSIDRQFTPSYSAAVYSNLSRKHYVPVTSQSRCSPSKCIIL